MPAVFVNGLINKHLKHLERPGNNSIQSTQPRIQINNPINNPSLQAVTFQTWPDTSKALINEQGVLRAECITSFRQAARQPGCLRQSLSGWKLKASPLFQIAPRNHQNLWNLKPLAMKRVKRSTCQPVVSPPVKRCMLGPLVGPLKTKRCCPVIQG